MPSRPKVIVTISAAGVERVQLSAGTEQAERASLKLYRMVRPLLNVIGWAGQREAAPGAEGPSDDR